MATIEYQSKGKWRISQMYNGKRYRITVESEEKPKKKDADLAINEVIQASIKTAGQQQPKSQKMTIREAVDRYIKSKENSLSPSTVRGYRTYWRNIPDYFSETMIDEITEEQMQQLVKWYQQEHSVKYTKNVIGLLTSVFGMFRKDFEFKVRYAVEKKEEPYIPTKEEVAAILNRAKGTEYELLIMLAACCGMRRGEILAITSDDLEANNVLHINKAIAQTENNNFVLKNTPKTKGSIRDIVLPDNVAELLREKGRAYNGHPNSVIRWLDRTEKQLQIKSFSFHKFRHYYCTTLHENGIPDAVIMKLGGWSDPSVMQRIYRHGRNDLETMTNAAAVIANGLF